MMQDTVLKETGASHAGMLCHARSPGDGRRALNASSITRLSQNASYGSGDFLSIPLLALLLSENAMR